MGVERDGVDSCSEKGEVMKCNKSNKKQFWVAVGVLMFVGSIADLVFGGGGLRSLIILLVSPFVILRATKPEQKAVTRKDN